MLQNFTNSDMVQTGLNTLSIIVPVAWLLRLEHRLTKIETTLSNIFSNHSQLLDIVERRLRGRKGDN